MYVFYIKGFEGGETLSIMATVNMETTSGETVGSVAKVLAFGVTH